MYVCMSVCVCIDFETASGVGRKVRCDINRLQWRLEGEQLSGKDVRVGPLPVEVHEEELSVSHVVKHNKLCKTQAATLLFHDSR